MSRASARRTWRRSASALPAGQPLSLRCADGRELVAHWFAAAAPRAALLMNPATGFPQTFYFRLASYCASRGYHTLIYDYRGMGASAPARSGRRNLPA